MRVKQLLLVVRLPLASEAGERLKIPLPAGVGLPTRPPETMVYTQGMDNAILFLRYNQITWEDQSKNIMEQTF
jgi:hypothetical protein